MSQVQRTGAVEKLFPPGVIAFELRGPAAVDDLFPTERECVARAVDRRVREFAAGRLCARAGLTALGFEPAPLLVRPDRTPAWPPGIVGSITHADDYCVAVVGREWQFAALGVDAECREHVSASLWHLIMHPEERNRLHKARGSVRQQLAAIIFSAKEAFYKCQYALTGQWLGFEEVLVNVSGNAFEVTVIRERHPIRRLLKPCIGRFTVEGQLVVGGIAVERWGSSPRVRRDSA